MKILIIRMGALGDTVLTFPLLYNIKKNYHCEVIFAGHPEYYELIPYFHLGKGMNIENRMFLSLFSNKGISNQLLEFLHQFDKIIYISRTSGDIVYQNLQKYLYQKQIIFIPSIPDQKMPIRIFYSLEIRRFLPLEKIDFFYTVKINDTKEINHILIHTGSGSPKKNWKVPYYMELIRYLLKKQKYITLIEGKAEANITQVFFDKFHNQIQYIKIENLKDFIKICNHHDYYIGNDSGITHLAGITGIKGLAIFGRTDPWLWNPTPFIQCLYRIKDKGIEFPNVKDVINYLEKVMLF